MSDFVTMPAARPVSGNWFDSLSASTGFVEGLATCDHAFGISAGPRTDPAVAEAFRLGETAGREAAETQAAIKDRAMRELRLRFGTLDSAALELMEAALSETVLSLCDQVLADHASDPDLLAQRCRDAAKRLGEAAKNCALHLHPDDAAMLAHDMVQQWRIVPDETLERGSVLFEGPDGAISDGPREWRYAIAQAIGLKTAPDGMSAA